jgi:ATP-dependent helicase/DNAse subunit B
LLLVPPEKKEEEIIFSEVLEKIKPPDFGEFLYLVPTHRKVREALKTFAEYMREKKGEGYFFPPQILTLSDFAQKKSGLPFQKRVSDGEREVLLSFLLRKLSQDKVGVLRATADFIKMSKSYLPHLSFKELEALIKNKLEEVGERQALDVNLPSRLMRRLDLVFDVSRSYEKIFKEKNLYDQEDELQLILEKKEKIPFLAISGFYDITELEWNVFRHLLFQAENSWVSVPFFSEEVLSSGFISRLEESFKIEKKVIKKSGEKKIFLERFSSRESEVREIARKILSLKEEEKVSFHQILVTFPSLESYAPFVERIFSSYGIPFNLSCGKPLKQSPPIRDILLLLRSISEGFPRNIFSQVLSSPFFSLVPEELKGKLEMITCEAQIVKGEEEWKEGLKLLEKISPFLRKEAKDLSSFLKETFKLIKSFKKRGNFRIFNERLNSFLGKKGFFDFLESRGSEEDLKAWESFRRLLFYLEKMDGVFELEPHSLSFEDYYRVLKASVLRGSYWVSGREDGVQVLGLLESRGLFFPYIFFGGLVDEEFPGKVIKDVFLPEAVKEEIGFPSYQKRFSLMRMSFERLLSSGKWIYLSYPQKEGEVTFLPTRFLQEVQLEEGWRRKNKVFSLLEWQRSARRNKDLLEKLLHKFPEALPLLKKDMEGMFEFKVEKRDFFVTSIETFLSCPFRFLLRDILSFEPLKEPLYEREPLEWGKGVHQILEKIFSQEELNSEVDPERIKETFLLEARKIFGWNGRRKDLVEWVRLSNVAHKLAFLESQRRRRGISILDTEKKTSLKRGDFVFKGRIDRIDLLPEGGVEILDYKTGGKPSSFLQLSVYTLSLKEQGEEVKNASYLVLLENDCLYHPIEGKRRKLEKVLEKTEEEIERFIEGVRSGNFSPRKEGNTCFNCDYLSLCQVMECE